jgi:hypothetical protein
MSENESGFGGETKIRPSKEFAEKLFKGVFDKHNLDELRHLLDKYDWQEYRQNKEFKTKIDRGLTKLLDLRHEIQNGYDKVTDLDEVQFLIETLHETFYGKDFKQ